MYGCLILKSFFFDIGGTKTRVARSDDLKTFNGPSVFDTPQNPDEGIKKIIAAARGLANGEKDTCNCRRVSGPVLPETGYL